VDLLDRLGLETPIAQVGMGGGMATADLAGAVSAAGALGTVGILPPRALAAELARARLLAPGRPVAVNLLMPFVKGAHIDVAIAAGVAAAVIFYGFDPAAVARLRAAGVLVLHQVGTEEQARRALADGADGLVAQGLEAGGHLQAIEATAAFLPRALELAGGRPVLAAGGIHDADGVRAALDQGAAGVMCGSRFLLTEESGVHPLYQRRTLGAPRTIDTRLFGFGWDARHRVVPNAATERWCARREAGAPAVLALNHFTEPLARRLPLSTLELAPRLQNPRLPLFSPGPALRGMPDRVVDLTPLYAGDCVREIHSVIGAAQAVAELARGAEPIA
jgi:NAD(P)H-dependent flavin oxidoreductase YrpB (nitropropane dioxygenase family)